MKMSTKLFVGFGLLLVLMLIMASLGINQLSKTKKEMEQDYVIHYQKVREAEHVQSDVMNIAKYLANLLLADSPDSANSAKSADLIKQSLQSLINGINVLGESGTDNTESQLIHMIKANGDKYSSYVNDAVNLSLAGKKEEAGQLRSQEGLKLQDELLVSLDRLNKFEDKSMTNGIESFKVNNKTTLMMTASLMLISLLLGIAVMFWIMMSQSRGLNTLSSMITSFEKNGFDRNIRIHTNLKDEYGEIAQVFNRLADSLEESLNKERTASKINEEQAWIKTNLSNIYFQIQGKYDLTEIARLFVAETASMIGAHHGAFYLAEQEGRERYLALGASYALESGRENEAARRFSFGEGLIGQAAEDGRRIMIDDVPGNYIKVRSSFGEIEPASLYIQPIHSEDRVVGVFEFASFRKFTAVEIDLLEQLSEVMAVIISSAKSRTKIEELLKSSQALTEELQTNSEELLAQQEELRASNEKLEEQTEALRASEELLQRQQEELEHSNGELLEKTRLLEHQVKETEAINEQMLQAKTSLEKQAVDLALSSKYKSEFLANMSHELRTPLNSMLILSQMLHENKEGNLTEKQVEYAQTIHASGNDLLRLIDDVLDLSKVEAGRMAVNKEFVLVKDITDVMKRAFAPVAKQNKVDFEVIVDENLPETVYTDNMRIQQILKNLLSNAFKFTHSGSVRLHVYHIKVPDKGIAFAVKDTGIGVPASKQRMIFEAFQQADGTTSRIYGGTGLGLSISKELAELLGGTIVLKSEEGKGSTFTLILPESHVDMMSIVQDEVAAAEESTLSMRSPEPGLKLSILPKQEHAQQPAAPQIEDDRDKLEANDKVVLIIEDDVHFAKVVLDMARTKGFKGVVALEGGTGMQMVREYKPDAIILDIQLPVVDGWSILVHLKNDASTRHIPVHVISVMDEIQQGLSLGAIAYLQKPLSRDSLEQVFSQLESFMNKKLKKLLILQDDPNQMSALVELISHDDVKIITVSEKEQALSELEKQQYDCMVIDYSLGNSSTFELLDAIHSHRRLHRLPVIIYTGKDLHQRERLRLKKYAESIIIKDVKSPERLLDETVLFLHRVEEALPDEKKQILEQLRNKETIFAGKKALIVDDDIRNVFALSHLLEGYDMEVRFAETGRQALDALNEEPRVDIILMDMMMPEMDGYEAMREIRDKPQLEKVPIIALTAKAMKDDRDKCISAGASDYITKPINNEQLLSLMRVWLFK